MQALKYLLILFVASFIFVKSPLAADKFTVDDLFVVKKAASATQARKLAIQEAGEIAFDKLIRSLIKDDDYYNLPVLSKDDISSLIKGFEVSEEKLTLKKYQARFSISFLSERIKKLLKENEIEFIENKGAPTLVLPVYQEGNNVILWGGDNPWWDAWEKEVSEVNVMPMILPLGDIEDINLLKTEDVFTADYSVFEALLQKYGAKNILVIEGQYDPNTFSGKASLEVVLRLIEKKYTEKRRAHYDGTYTQNKDYLLESAVNDLITQLEDDWSERTYQDMKIAKESIKPNIIVNIPINSLKDWLSIKEHIAKVDLVQQIEVIGLSSQLAKVRLFYKEDFATFSYFLGIEGFNLRKSDGDEDWYMELG